MEKAAAEQKSAAEKAVAEQKSALEKAVAEQKSAAEKAVAEQRYIALSATAEILRIYLLFAIPACFGLAYFLAFYPQRAVAILRAYIGPQQPPP